MEPENIYVHVSEIGEWTPELAAQIAGIKTLPSRPGDVMFSLTKEQMKRIFPELGEKEA